jgi:hypothetical protein
MLRVQVWSWKMYVILNGCQWVSSHCTLGIV